MSALPLFLLSLHLVWPGGFFLRRSSAFRVSSVLFGQLPVSAGVIDDVGFPLRSDSCGCIQHSRNRKVSAESVAGSTYRSGRAICDADRIGAACSCLSSFYQDGVRDTTL